MTAPESADSKIGSLTSRELEVLRLAANGLTNRDIASSLSIAESTVRVHLYRTYRVLGVNNRTRAALLYYNETERF